MTNVSYHMDSATARAPDRPAAAAAAVERVESSSIFELDRDFWAHDKKCINLGIKCVCI